MRNRGVGTEVSSIKPGHEKDDGKPRPELRFKYDTSEYDSFAKNGFESPSPMDRPDKWQQRFLYACDPRKGKVQVSITRMFRIQAIDWDSEIREKKDYLYYETEWRSKNWADNDIGPVEHVEGMHKEQTKKLVKGDFDPKTGLQEEHYVMNTPRTVYTIPFSKEAVDKILNNKNPFGPDSINVTDVDKIVYYGKFSGILGVQSFRCADYTYDQFTVKDFKDFLKLAIQEGGPQKRIRWPNEDYEVTRADLMAAAKAMAANPAIK